MLKALTTPTLTKTTNQMRTRTTTAAARCIRPPTRTQNLSKFIQCQVVSSLLWIFLVFFSWIFGQWNLLSSKGVSYSEEQEGLKSKTRGSVPCACLHICAQPWALTSKFVHDSAQAVTLAQNLDHTFIRYVLLFLNDCLYTTITLFGSWIWQGISAFPFLKNFLSPFDFKFRKFFKLLIFLLKVLPLSRSQSVYLTLLDIKKAESYY